MQASLYALTVTSITMNIKETGDPYVPSATSMTLVCSRYDRKWTGDRISCENEKVHLAINHAQQALFNREHGLSALLHGFERPETRGSCIAS